MLRRVSSRTGLRGHLPGGEALLSGRGRQRRIVSDKESDGRIEVRLGRNRPVLSSGGSRKTIDKAYGLHFSTNNPVQSSLAL